MPAAITGMVKSGISPKDAPEAMARKNPHPWLPDVWEQLLLSIYNRLLSLFTFCHTTLLLWGGRYWLAGNIDIATAVGRILIYGINKLLYDVILCGHVADTLRMPLNI